MTTEARQDVRRHGVMTVGRSASAAFAAGLLITVAGLLVGGGDAALAAFIGTVAVVAVLFSGALVVTIVADLMPAASLMVAMLTYTLQMALLGLLLLPLSATDWAGAHLDATWLALAVIGGALSWTVCQVLLATRARIPVYDLPDPKPSEHAGAAPSGAVSAEGGER